MDILKEFIHDCNFDILTPKREHTKRIFFDTLNIHMTKGQPNSLLQNFRD